MEFGYAQPPTKSSFESNEPCSQWYNNSQNWSRPYTLHLRYNHIHLSKLLSSLLLQFVFLVNQSQHYPNMATTFCYRTPLLHGFYNEKFLHCAPIFQMVLQLYPHLPKMLLFQYRAGLPFYRIESRIKSQNVDSSAHTYAQKCYISYRHLTPLQ